MIIATYVIEKTLRFPALSNGKFKLSTKSKPKKLFHSLSDCRLFTKLLGDKIFSLVAIR